MSVPNAEDPYNKLEEHLQILELYGFDQRYIELIEKANIHTIRDLQQTSVKDILKIPGCSFVVLNNLKKSLTEFLKS